MAEEEFECPSCGQVLEIPESGLNSPLTCPVCQKSFVVRGATKAVDAGPDSAPVWHLFVGGSQRLGPLSEQTVIDWIQQGRVASNDLVWRQGMGTWVPCSSTPPFSAHISRAQ